MKKVVSFIVAVLVALVFTGCGTGGGSSDFPITTNEEIAAVESSLLLDRVMVAETLDASSPEILASTLDSVGAVRYRNRLYKAANLSGTLGLSRGAAACLVMVGSTTLQVGTEQAKIERLDSGAIRITRGNGSIIEIPVPIAGEITSFIVDGIEWQATYGSLADEPLVTLKNTKSGMILRVTELDDGSLTIVRDSSEVFTGRWSEDGSIELRDENGRTYRYRYGRCF